MKQMILGLLAETFIHPGSGQNEGAIDLPVAREAVTHYPFIAGSSLKGALLDSARQRKSTTHAQDFGAPTMAGELLIGDARILLLPIRSLTQSYRWVTCPHVLERISRDVRRSGIGLAAPSIPSVSGKDYFGVGVAGTPLYLEERQLAWQGMVDPAWVDFLKSFIPSSEAASRIAQQLVVVSDDTFQWFASYGLAVQARNQLNPNTKESENLWYEETLSPDTVMYAVIGQRDPNGTAVSNLNKAFVDAPYIQVGGNETVGQGWFSVNLITK